MTSLRKQLLTNGEAKPKNKRDDANQAAGLDAVRRWQQLLKNAQSPEFTGTIQIRIPVKDGRLGETRTTTERYG